MTKDEADKIQELFYYFPNVIINVDIINNFMEITHSDKNNYIMRSFKLDPPLVVSPTVQQTFTLTGSQVIQIPVVSNGVTCTIIDPSGEKAPEDLMSTIKDRTKCVCGADSVGGMHSGYCGKGESK